MKRVLFITNYAAPYRIEFFNEWGKQVDLTVLMLESIDEQKHRNKDWFVNKDNNFKEILLTKSISIKGRNLCLDVIKWLKCKWDFIILGGYSMPTLMLAIEYMRVKNIPFIMEFDGGFKKDENKLKYFIKRHFISSAKYWLSSGDFTTNYLVHYGANVSKCIKYPFTSLKEKDLLNASNALRKDKVTLKKKLGMQEERIIISVGRFSYLKGYGKGYDILLEVAKDLDKNIGIYIIGEEPTEEFIEIKKINKLDNVHFLGFKNKIELQDYYVVADLFVLLTRGDVWGLVINEAMMYGLPIITTTCCGAGNELIHEGKNGFLVEPGNVEQTKQKIIELFDDKHDILQFRDYSLNIIKNYTIEKMVMKHQEIIDNIQKL